MKSDDEIRLELEGLDRKSGDEYTQGCIAMLEWVLE